MQRSTALWMPARNHIAMRTPTTSLRCLPAELRDIILEDVLTPLDLEYIDLRPKPPAIIVALRPDPELYQDAVQIYYKQYRFLITLRNFKAIQQLKTPYLASIRSLIVGDLYSDDPDYNDFVTNIKREHIDLTTKPQCKIVQFTKLETLCLSTDFLRPTRTSKAALASATRTLLANNPTLRRLELWTPQIMWKGEQDEVTRGFIRSLLEQKLREGEVEKEVNRRQYSWQPWWDFETLDASVWEAGTEDTFQLVK